MDDLQNIKILKPSYDESSEIYAFELKTGESDESLMLCSESNYTFSSKHNQQVITIPNKDDLKRFHDIHLQIKSEFLANHSQWFDNEFTENEIDVLFKSYLIPNIVENRIDLRVYIEEPVFEKLRESGEQFVSGRPVFLFKQLSLDIENEKMICELMVTRIETETKTNIETKTEERVNEPTESLGDDVPSSETTEEPTENNEVKDIPNNNSSPENIAEEDSTRENVEELEEVEFDIDELDSQHMNLNDEDYFIIYKFITDQIKENFQNGVKSILNQKNIQVKDNKLSDLFEDSDDESEMSDSEMFES